MAGKRLKKLVSSRARGYCEYCLSQEDYASAPFSIEHIIPRSKSGTDDPDNLAWACMGCNGTKSNITFSVDPITLESVPLFHPRTDIWVEHFEWSLDGTHMFGLTAIGRATVNKLRLNRPGVVNMRKVLIKEGKHPPGLESETVRKCRGDLKSPRHFSVSAPYLSAK